MPCLLSGVRFSTGRTVLLEMPERRSGALLLPAIEKYEKWLRLGVDRSALKEEFVPHQPFISALK